MANGTNRLNAQDSNFVSKFRSAQTTIAKGKRRRQGLADLMSATKMLGESRVNIQKQKATQADAVIKKQEQDRLDRASKFNEIKIRVGELQQEPMIKDPGSGQERLATTDEELLGKNVKWTKVKKEDLELGGKLFLQNERAAAQGLVKKLSFDENLAYQKTGGKTSKGYDADGNAVWYRVSTPEEQGAFDTPKVDKTEGLGSIGRMDRLDRIVGTINAGKAIVYNTEGGIVKETNIIEKIEDNTEPRELIYNLVQGNGQEIADHKKVQEAINRYPILSDVKLYRKKTSGFQDNAQAIQDWIKNVDQMKSTRPDLTLEQIHEMIRNKLLTRQNIQTPKTINPMGR